MFQNLRNKGSYFIKKGISHKIIKRRRIQFLIKIKSKLRNPCITRAINLKAVNWPFLSMLFFKITKVSFAFSRYKEFSSSCKEDSLFWSSSESCLCKRSEIFLSKASPGYKCNHGSPRERDAVSRKRFWNAPVWLCSEVRVKQPNAAAGCHERGDVNNQEV